MAQMNATEQLARWLHNTHLECRGLNPAVKPNGFDDISADRRTWYRYVAAKLRVEPPACLQPEPKE